MANHNLPRAPYGHRSRPLKHPVTAPGIGIDRSYWRNWFYVGARQHRRDNPTQNPPVVIP